MSVTRGPGGGGVSISAVRRMADGAFGCDTNAAPADLAMILAAAAAAAGWRDTRVFREVQQFTASRTMRLKHGIGSRSHELMAQWVTRGEITTVSWTVFDTASHFNRVADFDAMKRFEEALIGALRQYGRVVLARPAIPHNPIVPPGSLWTRGNYTGDLLNYSRLAPPGALSDLDRGIFSLGCYAFPGLPAPRLFLPETPDPRSREKLRHRGVLLCAPTRSGKTSLILNWAESAIANRFSTVILDPKGSLFPKLKDRLRRRGVQTELYYFTTDPRSTASDSINVLEGLACPASGDIRFPDLTDRKASPSDRSEDGGEDTAGDRLHKVISALLPRVKNGDDDQSFRRNLHRDWALAALVILKLAEYHFPDDYTVPAADGSGLRMRRAVDLADLYLLAASEDNLIATIKLIFSREEEIRERGVTLLVQSVAEPVLTLAAALDPDKLPQHGKRKGTDSYEGYAQPFVWLWRRFTRAVLCTGG